MVSSPRRRSPSTPGGDDERGEHDEGGENEDVQRRRRARQRSAERRALQSKVTELRRELAQAAAQHPAILQEAVDMHLVASEETLQHAQRQLISLEAEADRAEALLNASKAQTEVERHDAVMQQRYVGNVRAYLQALHSAEDDMQRILPSLREAATGPTALHQIRQLMQGLLHENETEHATLDAALAEEEERQAQVQRSIEDAQRRIRQHEQELALK